MNTFVEQCKQQDERAWLDIEESAWNLDDENERDEFLGIFVSPDCFRIIKIRLKITQDEHVENTARLLSEYAMQKRIAASERLSGNIQEALDRESRCERIYADLPALARW